MSRLDKIMLAQIMSHVKILSLLCSCIKKFFMRWGQMATAKKAAKKAAKKVVKKAAKKTAKKAAKK